MVVYEELHQQQGGGDELHRQQCEIKRRTTSTSGRVLCPLASSKITIFMVQFWFQVEDVDPLVGELWAPLASSDKLSDSHHGSEVKQIKSKRCKINKKGGRLKI
jgi:hypothetical protein